MTMKRKTKELTDDLYAHRNDPGEWSEEVADILSRPSKTEVISFRLPSAEFDGLENAAEAAGESLSEFIRGALAIRMHGVPVGPRIEIGSGHMKLIIRSYVVASGDRAENPATVPDFPARMMETG